MHPSILKRDGHIVDHIGYVAPDIDAAIDQIEDQTGVRPMVVGIFGAQKRAVLRLGDEAFLEILGPAPGTTEPLDPLMQAAVELPEPQILFWYMAVSDFDTYANHTASVGHALQMEQTVNRGGYHYRIAGPDGIINAPVVPWVIHWMAKMQELANAPSIGTLKTIQLHHPEPNRIQPVLNRLQIDLQVEDGARPMVALEIETANGMLRLS
ncbi:MAG: VOC family protein [Pseudomonadota bacterium]